MTFLNLKTNIFVCINWNIKREEYIGIELNLIYNWFYNFYIIKKDWINSNVKIVREKCNTQKVSRYYISPLKL